MRPKACSALSAMAVQLAMSATSVCAAAARPPASTMAATVSSQGLISQASTAAPSAAMASA